MKPALPLLIASAVGLGAASALAQTAPGDPAGNQTIPEKDQSRPLEPRNGGVSDPGAPEKEGRSLSDKLDEGGGVIKPPLGMDPGIIAPAPVPHPNSTPVIPPAGTPGGPPGPKPK